MKKLILLALVMCFSVSLNAAVTNESCEDYAYQSCVSESLVYGEMTQEEFAEAYTFYYNACIDAQGNIEPPVVIP